MLNRDIVVHHATLDTFAASVVSGPIAVARGKPNTDFGPGFYATTLKRQAQTVREPRLNEINEALGIRHLITIRVEDADAHCNRANDHGARITQEPVTYPYGERRYHSDDVAEHSWTFFPIGGGYASRRVGRQRGAVEAQYPRSKSMPACRRGHFDRKRPMRGCEPTCGVEPTRSAADFWWLPSVACGATRTLRLRSVARF